VSGIVLNYKTSINHQQNHVIFITWIAAVLF